MIKHIVMKRFYFFAFFALCLSALNSSAQQICYTISDSEDKVYKFKLSDGSIVASQSLSSLSSAEASTLNLDGDTLFILNQDELHYIDFSSSSLSNTKITGSNISAQKLTGSLGDQYIDDFDAMTVDTAGNIWAGSSDNSPCLMVVIDPSTGNVKEDFFGAGIDYIKVENGSWAALRFDAMAFDPLTNKLYANMNGSSQNYDYLFEISTTNGAMTLVRQFNTIDDVEGMAFDAIGELYVTTGSNASSSSIRNTLWHVDLSNGEVTKQFSLWGGDMETCGCVIGDPITAVEVSGYVFYDIDEDTTFTGSDIGTSGYLVNLYKDVNGNLEYDGGTDLFVDSIRTYADGSYKFRLGYTSGTDRYVLVTDTNDLVDGAYYTTDNIEIAVFTAGLQSDENNNFGFSIDSSAYYNIISGTVFGDSDEDTLLGPQEEGVAGVKVLLYQDKNCNGVKDGSDELVDSAIVGINGEYKFLREYNPSTGITTATVTKRVSSSHDDATEKSDGEMKLTEDHLHVGEKDFGVRFRSLAIPQGATITSAYIQFTADKDKSGDAEVTIYAEDTDDAEAFSSDDDDISDRDRTSANEDWSTADWDEDEKYNTPDLKDLVQEVVNRNGWVSGNDMVFIVEEDDGHLDASSYDASSSNAPYLVVTYQTGQSSDSTDCYVTMIDESTKPSGSSLTTDNVETAQFTSGGNHDSMNNFGMWGGSLPVEWLSFNGRYIGEEVELTWATAMEENNSHFVVLRSANGIDWEEIGEVAGAGFSSDINSYIFMDLNPHANLNYYRIKQVDFDGQSSDSRVLVLQTEKSNSIGMKLYPNPAHDRVSVSWTKNVQGGKLVLMDMRGQVLQNIEMNRNQVQEIDLTNLDRGFYLVEIQTSTQKFTKKLLYK